VVRDGVIWTKECEMMKVGKRELSKLNKCVASEVGIFMILYPS
jgi:hypothetical protein